METISDYMWIGLNQRDFAFVQMRFIYKFLFHPWHCAFTCDRPLAITISTKTNNIWTIRPAIMPAVFTLSI